MASNLIRFISIILFPWVNLILRTKLCAGRKRRCGNVALKQTNPKAGNENCVTVFYAHVGAKKKYV